jgi:glycine/D-amino acid oxidase-like deaminating enzyme
MMAFTRDYLPIVDRVPDMPGVLVVGGFCGHGMPFALRLGQLMAEALNGRAWPPELLPFRLNRKTLMDL